MVVIAVALPVFTHGQNWRYYLLITNSIFADNVRILSISNSKVVVWYKLSIKSDTALIVTPEQNVDRDDNTTGKKKKRWNRTSPYQEYINKRKTYHKCKTKVFHHWTNKKSSKIRDWSKQIVQAIKWRKKYHTVRTVLKSNIEIAEKDKIDIPSTQIHGLCSFFLLLLLWICVLVVAFCFWPVAVFVLVYWCTRALIVMCNILIQI